MRKFILAIGLVVISGYVGFLFGQQKLRWEFRNWKIEAVNTEAPKGVDFSLFWMVWDTLGEEYVDKRALDPTKMMQGAISGMVAALNDPYTVFLPPKQNEESKADLGGTFDGVGIQLGFKEKQLVVVTPLDGTPAKRAGVKAGDLIVQIKDEMKKVDRDTEEMTLPEAVGIIQGPKGTVVELTLMRDEKEPFKVRLTRDTIIVKSVSVDLPAGRQDLAVIKLSKFGDRTQEEWNEAVNKIADSGSKIQGVVLDLRNNTGGYLEGAVFVAGEFLRAGKVVVVQQYGDGSRMENKVSRNGRLVGVPLVVIVNEGSASAAEILAGALQDHKRAKIVGVKTFGKGSVQQPEDLPDGSGLHVTVAKWLLPSGRWIEKEGIKPDVEVESENGNGEDDVQLERAIELL